jgi:hypothetical protein
MTKLKECAKNSKNPICWFNASKIKILKNKVSMKGILVEEEIPFLKQSKEILINFGYVIDLPNC